MDPIFVHTIYTKSLSVEYESKIFYMNIKTFVFTNFYQVYDRNTFFIFH